MKTYVYWHWVYGTLRASVSNDLDELVHNAWADSEAGSADFAGIEEFQDGTSRGYVDVSERMDELKRQRDAEYDAMYANRPRYTHVIELLHRSVEDHGRGRVAPTERWIVIENFVAGEDGVTEAGEDALLKRQRRFGADRVRLRAL